MLIIESFLFVSSGFFSDRLNLRYFLTFGMLGKDCYQYKLHIYGSFM